MKRFIFLLSLAVAAAAAAVEEDVVVNDDDEDGDLDDELADYAPVLREMRDIEYHVYTNAQPVVVLVYTRENCAWCERVAWEFVKGARNGFEKFGDVFGFFTIEVFPGRGKLELATELGVTRVPELRIFTKKGLFDLYKKKKWRPSVAMSVDSLQSGEALLENALAALPSKVVKIIKGDQLEKHEKFLSKVKKAEQGAFLIFTDSTVTPLTKALGLALFGRAKFQQIVLSEEKSAVAQKYQVTSKPAIVVLGKDLKAHTFDSSLEFNFKNIYAFAHKLLPKAKRNINYEEDDDGDDDKDDPLSDLRISYVKSPVSLKKNVLVSKLPIVVAFRLVAPSEKSSGNAFARGDSPIENWVSFSRELQLLGLQSHMVHCDKEFVEEEKEEEPSLWWCPSMLEDQKKEGKTWVYGYYEFDSRSLSVQYEDASNKVLHLANDLEEAKESALETVPKIITRFTDVRTLNDWFSQVVSVNHTMPVMVIGANDAIPIFLENLGAAMAGTAEFSYCTRCDLEYLREMSAIPPNEVLRPNSYVMVAFGPKMDESKKKLAKFLLFHYNHDVNGKVTYGSTMAWILSLLQELNPDAFKDFVQTLNFTVPLSNLIPKGADLDTNVTELLTLEQWQQECGHEVATTTVLCLIAFLNSTSSGIEEQIEVMKDARNTAYKLGYASTTDLKFFWIDVTCQDDFAKNVFGLEGTSSSPALYAYHPETALKSQFASPFTARPVVSWIEYIRLGRGFSPLPNTVTKEFMESQWKVVDCEGKRKVEAIAATTEPETVTDIQKEDL